jgi:hypothetical protein
MIKYATGGKEALPALFWQTAATGLFAGTVGSPFIMPVANGVSKFLTNKSAMQNLYDMVGPDNERVADGVMYGLPGMLGISLTNQVGSPGADPARDLGQIASFAILDRMKSLSAGTKDAISNWMTTGQNPWQNQDTRNELVRALAPKTLYRAMAVAQDHAVHSMSTGFPITHDLGLGGALLYTAGLNPVELEKTYDVYNDIRDDQQKRKDQTTALGKAMAQALDAGDGAEANRILARTMAIGLDTSSVMRSATALQTRKQDTQLDETAKPQDRQDYSFAFPQQ